MVAILALAALALGVLYQSPIWGMVDAGEEGGPDADAELYQSPIWGMVEQDFVSVSYRTTTCAVCQPSKPYKAPIYDANPPAVVFFLLRK